MELTCVAQGLAFPEGPVWLDDGSLIVVEIASGSVCRITPDGRRQLIASTGGGPNGAAMGPDGALYICNNGGFEWQKTGGLLIPGNQAADYSGGRIERVDLATGRIDRLYDACDGFALSGPNDLIFDGLGGFYFTDFGKIRARDGDHGGVYYARADGSAICAVVYPLDHPNGCALSPDGQTLYVALTGQRALLAFRLLSPGIAELTGDWPGRVIASFPARQMPDSMAVLADGALCLALLFDGAGIAEIDPRTGHYQHVACPDPFTTNLCFGGQDWRDAFICLSGSGQLVRARWPGPGLPLHHHC